VNQAEIEQIIDTQSVISFCPTSNLFLGSGLFPYRFLQEQGVRIGLGTDVGAGTSFSLLETLNEAYKVNQLNQTSLSAIEGFYLATLGGARALSVDDKIGNFLPGKEADFIVLDFKSTPILEMRSKNSKTLEERLFALMILGDDRAIKATYIAGNESKLKTKQTTR
jgi:guanine deaminase